MGALEQGAVPVAVPLAEAKTHFRLVSGAGEGDDVLSAALGSATALCEAFTGIALVRRQIRETLSITGRWQRLALTPVSAITLVEGIPAEGSAFAFPAASYAIDIDMLGDGWVMVNQPGAAGRMRITYDAGIAADAATVPDALRQGIMVLAEHLYRMRDTGRDGDVPPATVAALWRPWRRMRLS